MSTDAEQLSAMLQAMISVRDKVKLLEQEKDQLRADLDVAIEALKFYADKKDWVEINLFGELPEHNLTEGDVVMGLVKGEDRPWKNAAELIARLTKNGETK